MVKTLWRALAKINAHRNPVYAAHGAAKPQKWGISLAAAVRVTAAAVVVVASRRPKQCLTPISQGFGRVGGNGRAHRPFISAFTGNHRRHAVGGRV